MTTIMILIIDLCWDAYPNVLNYWKIVSFTKSMPYKIDWLLWWWLMYIGRDMKLEFF